MPHTVLVIDDQWSMQELARVVLQTAGFHVLLAGDGQTGLTIARVEHPQIIIADFELAGFSGPELLRALQQDPCTSSIPVIMIRPTEVDAVKASAQFTPMMLSKPYKPPQLLNMIDGALKRDEMRIAV